MKALTVEQLREMRYEQGIGWLPVVQGVPIVECFNELTGKIELMPGVPPAPQLEGVAAILGEYLTVYGTYEGTRPNVHAIRRLLSDPRLTIAAKETA